MSEAEKKSKLKPHPLCAALTDEKQEPRETVQLVGYVGESSRPQHARLYMSLAFDEYVDVPDAAIVHHVEVPDTELAHGGTRLWIEASAEIVHEVRQSTRTEARFLEGLIASEHLQDSFESESAEEPAAFGTAVTRVICPITRVGPRCPPQTLMVSRCPPCTIINTIRVSLCRPCTIVSLQASRCLRCPTLMPQQCPLVTRRCPPSLQRCPDSRICPNSRVCGFPDFGPLEDPGLMGEAGFGSGFGDPWGRF